MSSKFRDGAGHDIDPDYRRCTCRGGSLRHAGRRTGTKVAIGISGWTGFAPLTLAKEGGIFAKDGLDVTIKTPQDSACLRTRRDRAGPQRAASSVEFRRGRRRPNRRGDGWRHRGIGEARAGTTKVILVEAGPRLLGPVRSRPVGSGTAIPGTAWRRSAARGRSERLRLLRSFGFHRGANHCAGHTGQLARPHRTFAAGILIHSAALGIRAAPYISHSLGIRPAIIGNRYRLFGLRPSAMRRK
jgi:hypothetical protein